MSRNAIAAMVLLAAWAAHAQTQGTCPDGHPIDGIQRAGTPKACVVLVSAAPQAEKFDNVLAVFVHGDNGGKIRLDAPEGIVTRIADKLAVRTLAIQRPGYRSDLGTSDGFTSMNDDDYTAGNIEIIAGALASIRKAYPARRILLIGHSGGAAMSALVAARFPESADAYLLAGCPCNVPRWREWRNASAGRTGFWSRSISPVDEASKVRRETEIQLMVGDKDKNTLPKFSAEYVAALGRADQQDALTIVPDADHGSIMRSDAFFAEASAIAQKLSGQHAKAD